MSTKNDQNSKIEEDENSILEEALINSNSLENTNEDEDIFYQKAKEYWSTIPATVDGMLGGFSNIHHLDILGSQKFLNDLFIANPKNKKKTALDCGAGIGRVSKFVLMPIFEKVDLVEQDVNFCQNAPEYIADEDEKLGKIYNVGLQKFMPEPAKYDIVWSQWVLGHLSDDDLIAFLDRIRVGLKNNGIFVLKENVTSSNKFELDDVDSSVTRPVSAYQKILKTANYKIIKLVKQTNFPKGLYPVYMIASQPF